MLDRVQRKNILIPIQRLLEKNRRKFKPVVCTKHLYQVYKLFKKNMFLNWFYEGETKLAKRGQRGKMKTKQAC